MTKQEVIDLMSTSKNQLDWRKNADIVKDKCKGYPSFWWAEIIQSGLINRILGAGSSSLKVKTIKEIKINGFTYYYSDGVLYEDILCMNPISKNQMTPNEVLQFYNQIKD